MTADIKQTLALIRTLWRDLPKQKADLQRYGDSELEILEALSDEAKTLRERCLQAKGERPGIGISEQVHEEIIAEAAKQAGRDRN
jgi:hypothetical protein